LLEVVHLRACAGGLELLPCLLGHSVLLGLRVTAATLPFIFILVLIRRCSCSEPDTTC
jgi:hypothetical protein